MITDFCEKCGLTLIILIPRIKCSTSKTAFEKDTPLMGITTRLVPPGAGFWPQAARLVIDAARASGAAGSVPVDTPMGRMNALHLVKQREAGDNNEIEVWLSTERNFVPVKLLIVESDGSRFEQIITRLDFN